MVNLGKTGLVSQVELTDREDNSTIGTGGVERTGSGHIIVHVDGSKVPSCIEKGFKIGTISVHEGE
jgi:hypothetical protein